MSDDLLTRHPGHGALGSEHDGAPAPDFAIERKELMELLKNREIRRRYIHECMQGDLHKLVGWIDSAGQNRG